VKLPPGVSLGEVKGCAKPKCVLRAPLNRHHRRHEALWLSVWAHRGKEPKYRALVKRYHEFREEDWERICECHHAEIHLIYDMVIADDMARTGLPLYLYSWKQANILMDKLEQACLTWLALETPGIDSKLYERTKKMWRGLQNKQAQRRHSKDPNIKKVRSRRFNRKRGRKGR
jgi:hypothetical protein